MQSARLGRSESPQCLADRSDPCQGRIKRRSGYGSGRMRSHSSGRSGKGAYGRVLAPVAGAKLNLGTNLIGAGLDTYLPGLKEIAPLPDHLEVNVTLDHKSNAFPVKELLELEREQLERELESELNVTDTIDNKIAEVELLELEREQLEEELELELKQLSQNLGEFEVVEVADVDAEVKRSQETRRFQETGKLGLAGYQQQLKVAANDFLELTGLEIIEVIDVDTMETLTLQGPGRSDFRFVSFADVPEGPPVRFRSPEEEDITLDTKQWLQLLSEDSGYHTQLGLQPNLHTAHVEVVFDL